MKIKDIVALIDSNGAKGETYTSAVQEGEIAPFAYVFDLYCSWSTEFSKRMAKHWVVSWICTDTRVGLAVYCLDKVPVAISLQRARKSDEVIEFLSEAAALAVRAAVMEYMETPKVGMADVEEDLNVADLLTYRHDFEFVLPALLPSTLSL